MLKELHQVPNRTNQEKSPNAKRTMQCSSGLRGCTRCAPPMDQRAPLMDHRVFQKMLLKYLVGVPPPGEVLDLPLQCNIQWNELQEVVIKGLFTLNVCLDVNWWTLILIYVGTILNLNFVDGNTNVTCKRTLTRVLLSSLYVFRSL